MRSPSKPLMPHRHVEQHQFDVFPRFRIGRRASPLEDAQHAGTRAEDGGPAVSRSPSVVATMGRSLVLGLSRGSPDTRGNCLQAVDTVAKPIVDKVGFW